MHKNLNNWSWISLSCLIFIQVHVIYLIVTYKILQKLYAHLKTNLPPLVLVEEAMAPSLGWTDLCKQLYANVCLFMLYNTYFTYIHYALHFFNPFRICLYQLYYYLCYLFVSTDIVGWRQEARKIIIYISDDDVHHALDGLLAGILTPAGKE